jgi:hypothetical protein
VLPAAGSNFPYINRAISCPQHKTRVGPMNSECHADFLVTVIFVLASICVTRWLYLEQPVAPVAQNPPAYTDDWTQPPFE